MKSLRVMQSLAVAGALVIAAQAANAQSCLGRPDLSVMGRSLAGYRSGRGADPLVLGRLGMAGEKTFGGVQAGYGGLGFNHPKSAAVGGDIGYALPLESNKTTFCLQVQTVYQLGERRFGVRLNRLQNAAGVSLGRSFSFGQDFSIIPFVQADVVHHLYSYSGRYREWGLGQATTNEFGTELGVGFGLKIGQTFTLRPAVTIPTDWVDWQREPLYSFSASFGITRRRWADRANRSGCSLGSRW